MSSTTDHFSKLPTEINVNFLRRLDFRSLLACREVSRLLRTIVDGTAALQYIIALGASGLRVGSLVGPDTGSPECMAILDKYNTAWRNLEWTEHKILTETRDMETKWHLSGGVWAQLDESETAIHFYQLPSHLRGIKERQWVLQFDVKVETFNMDPSQDLLVLVHSKPLPVANHRFRYDLFITLRSLSTGDEHPLAVEAQGEDYHLMLDVGKNVRRSICPIQVCGNNIGRHVYDNLNVWNWRTGVQKLFRKCESFVFLDSDHVLVVSVYGHDTPTPSPCVALNPR
ncbi:hypothetical protein BV25DRAFT_1164035 [Artomyces pyxidatus]|uniref:Uncharacterized protein n=1 Tax=Artomyces pyxidatus TaxID=48021 RepID=A0ACB8SRQ3_9AGAM|nr:hypothetical protein BV25DRAFT_1164035 [Artomyces pyxidatus]